MIAALYFNFNLIFFEFIIIEEKVTLLKSIAFLALYSANN